MTTLFTPYRLGKLSLNNRIVMAPMTRNMSPGNVASTDVAEYYRRRAAGGVGLIITEGTCVGHKAAHGYPDVPSMSGNKSLSGWKNVIDAVHAEGGKIAPQLWHVGAIRRPGVEPGGDLPGYSPSGMAKPGKKTGHVMTLHDINEVIESFVQAAVDAERIGFDAIELHGAHGYLLDQFFWSKINQRQDQYGGSLANRLRFACEIVSEIRQKVHPDFPIIFRYSQWKQQDYNARLAQTPQELNDFLGNLVDAGVDIFHCSQRRFWEPEFDGSDLNLAAWTKKLTGKPTITVGSVGLNSDFLTNINNNDVSADDLGKLDELNAMLARQDFDLVAVGRALIANPDWPRRIKLGEHSKLIPYDPTMLKSL